MPELLISALVYTVSPASVTGTPAGLGNFAVHQVVYRLHDLALFSLGVFVALRAHLCTIHRRHAHTLSVRQYRECYASNKTRKVGEPENRADNGSIPRSPHVFL